MNIYLKTSIVVLCALIIVFLRQLPDINAAHHTPKGFEYSGQASWYDPWDVNVYVGAIRYGQHGHVLLVNQYRTHNKKEALLYPIYTITGYVFRAINPYILFHALAAGTGIVLCLSFFYLAYMTMRKFWYSLLAMVLVALGGGFGWVFPDGLTSADTYITSFTLMSSFQRSHEGIGTLLYIGGLMFYYFAVQAVQNKYRSLYLSISFVFLLLLIVFYPYYLLVYALVAGLYTLIAVKRHEKQMYLLTWYGVSLAVTLTLSFLYLFHIRTTSMASATTENLPNIPIRALILGYGPYIVFFFVQLTMKKNKPTNSALRFFLIWIITALFLAYVPLGYSRFYFRGLFFPTTLVVLITIQQLKFSSQRNMLIAFLIILLPLSSFYIFGRRMREAGHLNQWFYYSRHVGEAFGYIRQSTKHGVLSGYILGNYIPAKTNKSVYFGHKIQSPKGNERQLKLQKFYAGLMTEEQAHKFLTDNDISLVVYGAEERRFGGYVYQFLKLIYSNPEVDIYTSKT